MNQPETIRLGDLEVQRMGFGAMRLPGPGVWGEPDDAQSAKQVLRRAVELGITFIDTAWYYGPYVSNRLICEALHPYPRGLVIATKLGGKRTPDKGWAAALRPEELRQGAEDDLRTLRLERLDVVHLRYIPNSVPFLESLDALIALQAEGKIRHLALSTVDAPQLQAALARTPIVAVQNQFSVLDAPEAVLEVCAARGIAFIPYFPLAMGNVAERKPALAEIASAHGASPSQIALAWLMARSKVMLPIPGTGSLAHLEENWNARKITLTPAQLERLK